MIYPTIAELFLKITEKYQDSKIAFRYKINETWVELNYQQLRDRVEHLALGLMELGVHKGDRIGIVSENRIEWIISSLAINSIGAIDVPVFPILTAKQEEFVFSDCGATAIVVSNNFQLKKVLEFKERLASLRHIIVMNDNFDCNDLFVKSLSEIEVRGKEIKSDKNRQHIFEDTIAKIQPDDLLTIIYTSGTTGTPKGVMLSHNNISSNIHACWDLIGDVSNDTSLTFLPFCHAYERTTGFLTLFSGGTTINLAESIESVASNISEVKPTIMTTVPKLMETIKKKVYAKMEKEKPATKKIFFWAMKIGIKKAKMKTMGKSNMFINAQFRIADKLVFSKLRDRLGGRLEKFISGGAALADDVYEFFLAIGINVLQGYGLTEASPVVAANRLEHIEIGTIGLPLYNVEVKLADDGEILVKGPNVMKGYWNDEAATKTAIDEEGWLYTGDIGIWTERGSIKITDRKKNLFISSGGKNIAPQPIENLLQQSKFIEHVMLIGDSREYNTALISPDFNQLKDLATEFGIEFDNVSELIGNEKIIRHIKNDIDYLQKDLSKFERVRRFQLLSSSFSVDSGELSPKMSIKRHVVERKYSDLIENMYS